MTRHAGVVALLLTNHPDNGWYHPIEQDRKIIGRSSKECQISIPKDFRTVSRRHAEVWQDHRGCWIRDLGSRGGTRLNLIWIDRLTEVQLLPGDLIRLGETVEIQVVAGGPAADAADEALEKGLSESSSSDNTIGVAPQLTARQILRKQISPAETEVMLWISRGYLGNEELGRMLHRSPHTVRTQVGSILRKLGLHNRAEIIGWLKRIPLEAIDAKE